MTMGETPAQLIFGRDMLFDLSFAANWDEIRNKKERSIQVNNEDKRIVSARRIPSMQEIKYY